MKQFHDSIFKLKKKKKKGGYGILCLFDTIQVTGYISIPLYIPEGHTDLSTGCFGGQGLQI